ncbi:hypothetical protein [Dokdonia sp.]|uniref:hypothetical protein n=1 Tax=Dokdonia sp. TaxID=2024995 RepID=UPI003262FBDF
MKIQKLLLLLIFIITLASCSSDDGNDIPSINDLDNGALVEIVTTADNIIFNNNLDGLLDTIVEYRDSESGSLLDDFNIYITFLDNSDNTGDSTNALVREEVLLRTVEPTEFTLGQDGFPRHNLIITTQDFLTITNNTLDGIASGDEYIVRFELVLTDGRVFSVNNTGDNGGLTSDFNIITTVQ